MGDIQNYHTSPVEAAEIANKAGVKLLVLYHLTPTVANMLTERMFVRGVAEVRRGDWLVSKDGTIVELSLNAKDSVRVSDAF